jgi:hypothetical protein
MPRPRKIAYEKFAQFVASGLSLAESYRRTTGQSKNADVKGDQWHRYAGVKERIAELKAQNSRHAQMSREELLAFYAAVIRTPADQVSAGSPVIQSYEETPQGGRKIKLADKIAAGTALSRMTGWNQSEQLALTGSDSLTTYLLELRAKPIGGEIVFPLERRTLPLENGANGEASLRQGAYQ